MVGTVTLTGGDNFHLIGRFRAGPDFPRYRDILIHGYQLWSDDSDDWIDSLEVVGALGLFLEDPLSGRKSPIRDFQLEAIDQLEGTGVTVSYKLSSAEEAPR